MTATVLTVKVGTRTTCLLCSRDCLQNVRITFFADKEAERNSQFISVKVYTLSCPSQVLSAVALREFGNLFQSGVQLILLVVYFHCEHQEASYVFLSDHWKICR